MKRTIQFGLCTLFLTTAACTQDGSQPLTDPVTSVKAPTPQLQENNMAERHGDLTVDQQVFDAITDLANRIDIEKSLIRVRQANSVTWGSGAVGCPEAGMNYTQAVVPGTLLVLEANERLFRYHGRVGARLLYCPDDRAQAPAYGPGQAVM